MYMKCPHSNYSRALARSRLHGVLCWTKSADWGGVYVHSLSGCIPPFSSTKTYVLQNSRRLWERTKSAPSSACHPDRQALNPQNSAILPRFFDAVDGMIGGKSPWQRTSANAIKGPAQIVTHRRHTPEKLWTCTKIDSLPWEMQTREVSQIWRCGWERTNRSSQILAAALNIDSLVAQLFHRSTFC